MNVFIIHSGKDRERVEEQVVTPLRGKGTSMEGLTRVLLLENGGPFWKIEAKQKIRQAQMVVCALGATSSRSKNIAWEIDQALRNRKCVYILRIDRDAPLPGVLVGKDDFSKTTQTLGIEKENIQEILKDIAEHEEGEYGVFNFKKIPSDPSGQAEILEQYKLFLTTSENLVARRQIVNNFYLTANAVLISVIATVGKVGDGNWNTLAWTVLLIALIGIVISVSWRRLLEAYGTLNACKMKVIGLIERKLPLNLYRAEWGVMSDKLNNKRYVSFTENEKRLPFIFILFYGGAIVVCAAVALYHALAVS